MTRILVQALVLLAALWPVICVAQSKKGSPPYSIIFFGISGSVGAETQDYKEPLMQSEDISEGIHWELQKSELIRTEDVTSYKKKTKSHEKSSSLDKIESESFEIKRQARTSRAYADIVVRATIEVTDDRIMIEGVQGMQFSPIHDKHSSSEAETTVSFGVKVRKGGTVRISGCDAFQKIWFLNQYGFQDNGEHCSFEIQAKDSDLQNYPHNPASKGSGVGDPAYNKLLEQWLKDAGVDPDTLRVPRTRSFPPLTFNARLADEADGKFGKNTAGAMQWKPFKITIVEGDLSFQYRGVSVLIKNSCRFSLNKGDARIAMAIDATLGPQCIGPSPLKTKMTNALKKKGVQFSCPLPSKKDPCGQAVPGGSVIELLPAGFNDKVCGPLVNTVFHEMVHAHGGEPGPPGHDNRHDPNIIHPIGKPPDDNWDKDIVYACEEKCFPDKNEPAGDPSKCP